MRGQYQMTGSRMGIDQRGARDPRKVGIVISNRRQGGKAQLDLMVQYIASQDAPLTLRGDIDHEISS